MVASTTAVKGDPGTSQMPREIAEMCERLAGKIVTDIATHGVDEDDRIDAIEAGMLAAVKGWPQFDAARGWQPQTFLYPKIKNAMIDFFRRRTSYEKRFDHSETHRSVTDSAPDKHQQEAAWLADVYYSAKQNYVKQKGVNRGRTYPMPQAVAIATLMRIKNIGCRECARLLAARDDLRAVLKLKGVPHYSTLSRAASLFDKLTGLHLATADPQN